MATLACMLATFVNAGTVLLGSVLGLLLHRHIGARIRTVLFTGVGIITLAIGMSMTLEMQRVLFLALSVVIGGLLGTWWGVEDGIMKLGEMLKATFHREGSGGEFAYGFLSASVLFCVGALTIVGSFQAGADGNYELIFTKSVMDGFMAILLAASMGVGVAFSALVILVYQGGLTLLSAWVSPWVSDLMLSEITAVGGALILMIGVNLLGLKKIRTADYIPAILIVIVFVLLDPWIPL